MNRLTGKDNKGVYYRHGQESGVQTYADRPPHDCKEAIERLAEYEDTGLTQEEIKTLHNQLEKEKLYHKFWQEETESRQSLVIKLLGEIKQYKDAEEQGLFIKLPCKIGDTVYIIEQCENIPERLDGTLWDGNGGYGTATGYYCLYEDYCPHDTDECYTVKNINAVFEDTIIEIMIFEECIMFLFEKCNGKYLSEFGKSIFITREAAEAALKGSDRS